MVRDHQTNQTKSITDKLMCAPSASNNDPWKQKCTSREVESPHKMIFLREKNKIDQHIDFNM